MRTSKIYAIPEADFKKLISESKSRGDFLFKMKMLKSGGAFEILNKRIVELNLDISHFVKNGLKEASKANKIPTENILVENSDYNANDLKKRLIKETLLKEECNHCQNKAVWMGKKLVLQLDHKNGNRYDHRLENLRLLCPNCHSQTLTWGQKKRIF